jgi:AGCS family alanine or glycine:cation symporter
MVPFMAILYLLGGLFVIAVNITHLPAAFGLIFKYAFMPQAIIGGGIGYALKEAISQGAKRGLFSNEAGMGSTPHAHAMADVEKPHDQGVAAMIGVFIDTFIVLTMTALVVIVSLYCGDGPLGDGLAAGGEVMNGLTIAKTNMAQLSFGKAFAVVFGEAGYTIGNVFVAVCLFFFAFSTIIGWNFFGKVNIEYLFGKKGVIAYSVIALVFIFLGTLTSNDLVWELTDFVNYLMVLPNALALITLSGMVVESARLKKKNNPLA